MSANDMTILFKTSDNKTLTVSKATLQCSKFVCHLMEEIDATNAEPIVVDLPNISHSTLLRIVEFAEHEVKQQTAAGGLPASVTGTRSTHAETIELSPWEEQFCKVDQKTLFDIMMAANFLNMPSLLDVTCKSVAQLIRGKSPEQIRQTFNIVNDFTPEEEEQVRLENEWCLGTRN